MNGWDLLVLHSSHNFGHMLQLRFDYPDFLPELLLFCVKATALKLLTLPVVRACLAKPLCWFLVTFRLFLLLEAT